MNEKAGFWIRLGANLLDAIIIGFPITLVTNMFFVNSSNFDFATPQGNSGNFLNMLYLLLIPIFWSGYTVGKRICKIRIRRVNDQAPPKITNMLMRNIVTGLIYAITFGIGAIVSACMIIFREDKRALHDLIAGTEVVRD
ncbi:RDD family protein [Paenibacillus sp. N1-5-1-14]|uniref:RDD family protein n=1 Tax=Paenibacillus radicibacter TaxID=2972488 RepID=UPI0021592C75|nr:RDD family protein [Paenibacillus radicibacter]MCR8644420.1 RDD family protein [Paenibacillus radicibacter]